MNEKIRYFGDSPIYIDYHDNEWGQPVHDDNKLFEMLILEGAQAGLSWITVLKKRENYRKAFDGFDPAKVALYDDAKIEEATNGKYPQIALFENVIGLLSCRAGGRSDYQAVLKRITALTNKCGNGVMVGTGNRKAFFCVDAASLRAVLVLAANHVAL